MGVSSEVKFGQVNGTIVRVMDVMVRCGVIRSPHRCWMTGRVDRVCVPHTDLTVMRKRVGVLSHALLVLLGVDSSTIVVSVVG